MTTIPTGNWVRIELGNYDCPMPKCYNCDTNPRHWEFDGRAGILEGDFQDDLSCKEEHPGRAWSFEDKAFCSKCKHSRVTIREEMVAFRHTLAVCFEGTHSRFHIEELDDLGPSLGDYLKAEKAMKVLDTIGTPDPEDIRWIKDLIDGILKHRGRG